MRAPLGPHFGLETGTRTTTKTSEHSEVSNWVKLGAGDQSTPRPGLQLEREERDQLPPQQASWSSEVTRLGNLIKRRKPSDLISRLIETLVLKMLAKIRICTGIEKSRNKIEKNQM